MKKSLFLFRSQHHDHLAAFELGLMFNLSHFGELRADAVHQLHAELLVSHFTAAVAQRDLGLVAVIEESHQGGGDFVWKSFSSVTGRNFTSLT